jgi:hypothetical protein
LASENGSAPDTSARLKLHLEGGAVATVTLGDLAAVDTRFPFILFVSQTETEAVLNDYLEAAGVLIERGHELISFEREDEGLQCVLQRPDAPHIYSRCWRGRT